MKQPYLRTLLLSILLLASISALSQPDLRIRDTWWGSYGQSGEITEASLVFQPKGAFVQCEMTFTVSASHLTDYFQPDDSLEAIYFFDLPKGSIGYDSWLWIDNYISYGILLDVDSASEIYQSIVNIKTDPSILFKRSETRYELRIYPISGNLPRKVKLSFLLPTEWTKDHVLSSLPLGNISPYFTGDEIEVIVLEDSSFQNPTVRENPDLSFQAATNAMYGDHFRLALDNTTNWNHLTLAFDSPLQSGQYASYFPTDSAAGVYQLAVLPVDSAEVLAPEKVLFLIDFESGDAEDARSVLSQVARQELSPSDSFNILLNSPNGIIAATPVWMPAEPFLLDLMLDPSWLPLSQSSDLLPLLRGGIAFMEANNNDGSILLISNTNDFGGYTDGRRLMDSLLISGIPPVPIHIVNYQEFGRALFWDVDICGNRYGNEFAYYQIASLTGGSFFTVRGSGQSLYLCLGHALMEAGGRMDSLFVDHPFSGPTAYPTSCFPNSPSLHRAYVEVGKATAPLDLQGSLIYYQNQQVVQNEFQLDLAQAPLADSMLRKSWAGLEILAKEREPYSSSLREEIVDLCLEERLLSYYTAFLCLEDSTQNGFAETSTSTSIETTVEASSSLQVFPNPFRTSTRIQLHDLSYAQLAQTQLHLYNLEGKLIYTFPLQQQLMQGQDSELQWNGTDQQGVSMPAGVYLLTFTQGNQQETVKVIKY